MRMWWPLSAVSLGAFMLLLDVTVLAVALPAIDADLDGSVVGLQWTMSGYSLALASLLLGAGSLADRWGLRRVYLAGLLVFAGASLACALAPSVGALVAARCLQGVGGAAVYSAGMATLTTSYQGRARAIAFGVWGSVNGAAAATGPILGGVLTQHLSWHWVFLINLPVSLAVLLMMMRVRPRPAQWRAGRVDAAGTAAGTVAAAAIVSALISGGDSGWASMPAIAAGVGAIAIAVFIAVERRAQAPILDLGLMRTPAFVGLLCGVLLFQAASFAHLPYTSLWLQSELGFGAQATGLAIAPLSLTAVGSSVLTARLLAHRLAPRALVASGLALVAAGAFVMATLAGHGVGPGLVAGLVIVGLGVGVAAPVQASTALALVPPHRAGMASGAFNSAAQLGFALGVAVLGTVVQTSPAGPGSAMDGVYLAAGLLGLAGCAVVAALVRVPAAVRTGAPEGRGG